MPNHDELVSATAVTLPFPGDLRARSFKTSLCTHQCKEIFSFYLNCRPSYRSLRRVSSQMVFLLRPPPDPFPILLRCFFSLQISSPKSLSISVLLSFSRSTSFFFQIRALHGLCLCEPQCWPPLLRVLQSFLLSYVATCMGHPLQTHGNVFGHSAWSIFETHYSQLCPDLLPPHEFLPRARAWCPFFLLVFVSLSSST